MATVRISYEFVREAMQSSGVRAALRKKADGLATRVDAVGSSEGVAMNAKVSEGTRPKGRPFARVESDQVSQEWGSRDSERRRILGRVAEES